MQCSDKSIIIQQNHSKTSTSGKIYAYEYDLGKINEAYSDKDFQNLWVKVI